HRLLRALAADETARVTNGMTVPPAAPNNEPPPAPLRGAPGLSANPVTAPMPVPRPALLSTSPSSDGALVVSFTALPSGVVSPAAALPSGRASEPVMSRPVDR